MPKTTRDMSDRHEQDLLATLGGKGTLNSGATWRDPADGHQTLEDQHYRFAWDGKSTLGRSVGVSLEMWTKAVEQSRNLDTLLPLRFYANTRLTEVAADLVVLDLDVFAQVLADANTYRKILDVGCLGGVHEFSGDESASMVRQGPCVGCGARPYEASYQEAD